MNLCLRTFVFILLMICLNKADCRTTCCKDGWLPYNGSCYWYYSEHKVDWLEAVTFCKNHNSDLVVIETENENRFLKAYARTLVDTGNARRNITAYWIGASDIDTEGIWKWEGPDVELMYKDPNFQENTSPNNDEDCIALNGYDDFNWHDGVCYERVGYPICEIMTVADSNGGMALIG